jgi:hypothetical protein
MYPVSLPPNSLEADFRIGDHAVEGCFAPPTLLCAFDLEREIDIPASRMAVRTDPFVRLFNQRNGFVFWQRRSFHLHPDSDTEAASFARPHRSVTGHYGSLHILLVLTRNELNRAAETRGVPGREQVLRRRSIGQSGPTHFLADGQVHAHRVVGRF